ncbi:MAG: hypothetical protein JWN04_2921 [Myxococcaceae bacterium]|nr:hypothetical protein [Myxococcaceae bacterium]
MDDATFNEHNHNITKKAVQKWAKDWAKRFRDVRTSIEKSGEDFEHVLKGLDVESPTLRLFRNTARKLKREATTAGRYSRSVLKHIDGEIKHYTKIAEGLTEKNVSATARSKKRAATE